MTNEEIIQRGQLINDETEPAQNTSERVGGVIKGIGQNLADKDTAIAAEAARNGYYQCTVSGTTLAVTAPGFTLPAHGGNIRIKMSAPATGASTLNINGTGPKTLLYNGAAVSSVNTWEQNEIISVFYDPSGSGQYLASNSQGGGGKAEKIKYDNSQSGLSAENVQEAVDDIIEGNYSIDLSAVQIGNGLLHVNSGVWVVDSNVRQHFVIPRISVCNKLLVTAPNGYFSSIYFLKSYITPVNNAAATLSDSPLCCVMVPAGESAEFDIPDDCKYIIVMKRNVGNIQEPTQIAQKSVTKTTSNKEYSFGFHNIAGSSNWIGSLGEPITTSGTSHYKIPLPNIKKVAITASQNAAYYAFASAMSSSDLNGWVPNIAKRYDVPAGETKEVEVPDGTICLIVGKKAPNNNNDFTPSSITLTTEEGLANDILSEVAMVDTSINISQCEELWGWLGSTGDFVKNSVGAAHISIPVVGKTVTITPHANNSYCVFASAIDGFNWTLAEGETRTPITSVKTINIPDSAKYIIFGVRSNYADGLEYTPQSVVFHEELPSWINRMNIPESETLWRFMNYNIGHLNGGGVTAINKRKKSSITDADYDKKKEVGLAICNQFHTNFIGIEEYPLDFAPFSASHSTETTREILFKCYWSSYIDANGQEAGHEGDVNYDEYNAMFGRIPLFDMHKVAWESELLTGWHYMVATGLLGECETKIVVTHFRFSSDFTDTTKQEIQVAELIAAFEQDEYVIIMGDLNLPSLSVLNPFIAAGYSIANGGEFGPFNTYRKTDAFANRALDNIIVKGFNIKKVYMIDNDLSDHNPILADLEVI